MYISQPFLLHLPPFHLIRLCPTTSPRKLASSCVVQTRVPRILLAGVGRCTRSLSLSHSLSVLCTHFALGLLFSHCSPSTISLSLSPKGGPSFFSLSPPPSLNRVVSRTLGATFRPSLSKQRILSKQRAKIPLLSLSLSRGIEVVDIVVLRPVSKLRENDGFSDTSLSLSFFFLSTRFFFFLERGWYVVYGTVVRRERFIYAFFFFFFLL